MRGQIIKKPEPDLFISAQDHDCTKFELPPGTLQIYWDFVGSLTDFPGQDKICRDLIETVPWEQRYMPRPGTWNDKIAMPRLERWFCDVPGVSYRYAGNTYDPLPISSVPYLSALLHLVNVTCLPLMPIGSDLYNAAFMNYYRDESDSIGWHADDEPVLGPVGQIHIASLSLGATRWFRLRGPKGPGGELLNVELPGGSLLWMGPGLQTWKHCAPKSKVATGPRVCITFRRVQESS